ncbi:MAG: S4 domain-containing protein, partial [Leptotrichiaceae bacterium]
MRLDKFLANAGVGTRKEVREILKKRKVLVNGNFEKDGSTQINEDTDEILMDGEKLSYNEFIYLMLNKPDGVISATEDARHKTVIDLLDEKYKKYQPFPVGRLDQDTEG